MAYLINETIKLNDFIEYLGLQSNFDFFDVEKVSTFNDRQANSLTFYKGEEAIEFVEDVVVCGLNSHIHEQQKAIFSNNPRLDFIRLLEMIDTQIGFASFQPHVVHTNADIHPSAVLEQGVSIGAGTVVQAGAVIHKNTRIGENSLIKANAVIGTDGFGFERTEDGSPIKFVHLGGVQIGNRVEIGVSTAVCKGALADTVVDDDVKIDNFVHVAHNCIIKKGAFITACAELSGGVVVGENAWIGPNASIIQKTNIEDNALVGIGAVILKDVPVDAVVVGNPAKILKKKA